LQSYIFECDDTGVFFSYVFEFKHIIFCHSLHLLKVLSLPMPKRRGFLRSLLVRALFSRAWPVRPYCIAPKGTQLYFDFLHFWQSGTTNRKIIIYTTAYITAAKARGITPLFDKRGSPDSNGKPQ
jgi:hypothetical protein